MKRTAKQTMEMLKRAADSRLECAMNLEARGDANWKEVEAQAFGIICAMSIVKDYGDIEYADNSRIYAKWQVMRNASC